RTGFEILLNKSGGMVERLQQQDSAFRSHTFISLDRLNIAESLRAAILRCAHSEQEVAEALESESSPSETNIGRLEMLSQSKDPGPNGMAAVIPRQRIRPGIAFAASQKVAVRISRDKASQWSFHGEVGQAQVQSVRRCHPDG